MSVAETSAASSAATLLGAELLPAFRTQPPPLRQFAGSIGLVALGVVLFGLGVLLMLEQATVGAAVWLLLGIVAAAIGIGLLKARRRGSCSITTHERGVVIDRGRAVPIPFSSIDALEAEDVERLQNGERFGRWRTFTLRVGGQQHCVANFSRYGADGEEDEFVQVFAAVLTGRTDTARADLAAGKVLAGKGWQLNSAGLIVGRSGERVGWPELAAADIFDGRAQLWRVGRDLPMLSVPEASPNAYTLLSLVQERIEAREQRADDGVGFGRLLFRRRENRAAGWVTLGLTLLFGAPVVLGLVEAEAWSAVNDDFIMAMAMASLTAPLALASFLLLWPRADFYERGVRRRGVLGWRAIRYDEVHTLRYAETIRYHNGAYAGATVKARFIGEGTTVKVALSMRRPDEDLERIRATVTSLVADRMQKELEAKGRVRWVEPVWLTTDALEAQIRRRLRESQQVRLGYDQNLMFSFQAGNCRIYPADQSAWLEVPAAGDNFFPGFELFGRLAGEPEVQEELDGSVPEEL